MHGIWDEVPDLFLEEIPFLPSVVASGIQQDLGFVPTWVEYCQLGR